MVRPDARTFAHSPHEGPVVTLNQRQGEKESLMMEMIYGYE